MASVTSIILQEPSLFWKNHSQYSPQLPPRISFPRSHFEIRKNLKKLSVNCSFTTNDRSAAEQRVSKISFGKWEDKRNPVEIMAEAVKNMLKALRKPAVAALVVGLLLMSNPNSTLAASGGRMGGRAFSSQSSSSTSSSPSRSTSPSSSSSSSPSRKYSSTSSPSRSTSSSSSPSRSYSSTSSPSWSYSTSSSSPSQSQSYSKKSSSSEIDAEISICILAVLLVYFFLCVLTSVYNGITSVVTAPGRTNVLTGKTNVITAPGGTNVLTGKTDVLTAPSTTNVLTGKTNVLTAPGTTNVLTGKTDVLTAPSTTNVLTTPGTTNVLTRKTDVLTAPSTTNVLTGKNVLIATGIILIAFAAFVIVSGFLSEGSEGSVVTPTGRTSEGSVVTPTGKTSVLKLQVGLLGSARSLQTDLNRIAEIADTSTAEGLHYVLTETVLALLRHPDYWISGYSSVDVKRSMEDGEILFNILSIEERSKFDEETLVNVDNIKRQSSTIQRADGVSNEYIAITILVAAEGEHELPSVNNSIDLKEALQKLASILSSKTKAVEVLWTPQNEDDTLSEQELLKDYPLLRPL